METISIRQKTEKQSIVDIHAHILPQVDDGSISMQMSHDMLIEAKRMGVDVIVATPHFRNMQMNRHRLQQIFTQVQNDAFAYGICMRLGFEVHFSMLAHLEMASIADWCVQDTNVILLELPNTIRPARWDVTICDLVQNGYKPIIVHPERCEYIQKSMDIALELKRYGCELQVDAMSLGKYFSFASTEGRTAEKLLRNGVVDYIASDAHCPEHYDHFGRVYRRYAHRWPINGCLYEM